MEPFKETKFQLQSKRLLRSFVLRALDGRKPLNRLIREQAEYMRLSDHQLYTRLNIAVWILYNRGLLAGVVRKYALDRCPTLSEVVAYYRDWEE